MGRSPRGGRPMPYMLTYFLRRSFYLLITVALVSVVAFVLIQLPPGDYLTTYVIQLENQGSTVSEAELAALRRQFGLDRPILVQYLRWIWNIVSRGNFGRSLLWNVAVSELIWDRMGWTMVVALGSLLFTYALAIPIGIYSALHKYSAFDFSFTVIGYVGLATPNFFLALLLMYLGFRVFGQSVGGLFSPEYADAPWSLRKLLDMLSHLWVPVVVLGTAGTASIIRVMRSMLLDELRKQYVVTARAKGLAERRLVFRYPVRIALNPIVATIGWQLAAIISGAPIVGVVLSLPTTGALMLRALLSQDMLLAGAFILLLSVLTVVGTFISDLLLAALDPRIRLEQ